ncbi:MAG: DUF2147 domain-containing protein, partial [Polyangia bacterium]
MEPIGPNRMLRRTSVVATAMFAVISFHTAVLAQQSRAPDAPPAAAAEAAPPAAPTPPPGAEA